MGTRLRTARKLLLGREIEHMMAKAGVSQSEAAAILETSQSRIAMLVGGVGAITIGDLERLATALGFTDPGYLETLQELRRDGHKRGFWSTGYRRAYVEDLRLLVDLEAHAALLRVTEAEIVPGLLQCESYIRALHEPDDSAAPDPDRVTVEDSVRARLARQEILAGPNPPRLQAILSESCLRRAYGGRTTMLEQLEYLQKLSQRPHLLIQVLPFTVTTQGAGMEDRFTLVRVPSPGIAGDLDIAIAESQGDIRYIDDKAGVAARETVWARLSAAALGADDSRDFIDKVARSFRRKTVTGP
ncbi:helix-turn-helix domain-containing protein [Nocardia blacklockiae]|uniref:helix-turn-helix domain-containing protein n=1 Tax=Nocardia blacklockiae TaxID=480036 RepID=UPI001893E2A0|nr:helix-turn-helix transcriptional regulator [Nocardia blacklockiae]MBF6170981.1 helix-turn-helix transcriptional regulator [Nocardia blacklockiae]